MIEPQLVIEASTPAQTRDDILEWLKFRRDQVTRQRNALRPTPITNRCNIVIGEYSDLITALANAKIEAKGD